MAIVYKWDGKPVEIGGSTQIVPLSVSSNGTYTAPPGNAYSPVTVTVQGGGDADGLFPTPAVTPAWAEEIKFGFSADTGSIIGNGTLVVVPRERFEDKAINRVIYDVLKTDRTVS